MCLSSVCVSVWVGGLGVEIGITGASAGNRLQSGSPLGGANTFDSRLRELNALNHQQRTAGLETPRFAHFSGNFPVSEALKRLILSVS